MVCRAVGEGVLVGMGWAWWNRVVLMLDPLGRVWHRLVVFEAGECVAVLLGRCRVVGLVVVLYKMVTFGPRLE